MAARHMAEAKKHDLVAHVRFVGLRLARDRQMNHKQWFLGNALDGFCPRPERQHE